MAEKWKTNDSARTMTKKFNNVVDELNQSQKTLENQQAEQPTVSTGYAINGLTESAVEQLIGLQKVTE